MIYILSGPVHTGKSSALMQWIGDSNKCGGFLSPDIEGHRMLYNLQSKEYLQFQVDHSYQYDTVEVGPYIFAQKAFDAATEWTINQISDKNVRWIVIDELGKLELKKEGFYSLTRKVLKAQGNKHYIFVVRDYLVSDLIKLFDIKDYKIIASTQLFTLKIER